MTPKVEPSLSLRVGGVLCLDFCNTVSWPGTTDEVDWFARPGGLAAWCNGAGLAKPEPYMQNPAFALRLALRRSFLARARGEAPAAADLAAIWAAYAAGVPGGRLQANGPAARVELAPGNPLAPIAASAIELLCDADAPPLRLCGTPDCGWLFLDRTKNRRQRFCDLRCGNRARARAHYARHKGGV
jgi:predicted RNA-binding Zn ribbon-like protein